MALWIGGIVGGIVGWIVAAILSEGPRTPLEALSGEGGGGLGCIGDVLLIGGGALLGVVVAGIVGS